jgi:hypothetical protein
LFGDGSCPFILYDQQKSIGLKIFQLEPEMALVIGFGLSLNRTADTHGSIYRGGPVFIRTDYAGYFCRLIALELIV